jgi:hypothetical protein
MLFKGSFAGREKGILRTLFLVAGITKGARNPRSTTPRTDRRYKYLYIKKKLRYSLVPLFVKPFGGFQGYKKAKNKSKSEMFFFRPPA